MKRAILAVLAVLALGGTLACSSNPLQCQQSVEAVFPGGDVKTIPGSAYRFVVKDAEGNIWYVEAMNTTDSAITGKVMLFRK